MNVKRLVWLASYPKAGSTWFRALLANVAPGRTEPASINSLGAVLASSRAWFDRAAGVEASDLTHDEVDVLRSRVYASSAAMAGDDEPRFHKIHDAFARPADDEPLVPVDATHGAIYLVRNPLDVCLSYAHHASWDVDTAIERMADDTFALCGRNDCLQNQLRQHVSSWSGHVRSWVDNGRIAVHVVRYEDLSASPAETVAAALAFAGVHPGRALIDRAVEWSRLERLQAQEREAGFGEKPASMPMFFRRGVVGGWRDHLTPEQVARVVSCHVDVMTRFGYLDEATA